MVKEWTDKERLEAITQVAVEMREKREAANYKMVIEWQEKILYLAVMPASFLEANKDKFFGEVTK